MTPDRLIADLVAFFDRLQIRYAIVGSVASIAYGEPRFTNDVDVVADLQLEHVEPFLSAFPGPDFYCSREAMQSAIRKRFQFNVIHSAEGVKADIIIPTNDGFDRLELDRRQWVEVGESGYAWVASPEDVMLKKMEYYQLGGSEKHLRDIASMLRITKREIDYDYLADWIAKLNLQATWALIQEKLSS
ncbi:hypothetical protein NA78x_005235 [Anatilimnocola sp. NA78]|uniref:hypothetical protein n=1 Tax=Anatilimnocola sp. NA78 TaxID=3415683 RepID=UPI003CE490E1